MAPSGPPAAATCRFAPSAGTAHPPGGAARAAATHGSGQGLLGERSAATAHLYILLRQACVRRCCELQRAQQLGAQPHFHRHHELTSDGALAPEAGACKARARAARATRTGLRRAPRCATCTLSYFVGVLLIPRKHALRALLEALRRQAARLSRPRPSLPRFIRCRSAAHGGGRGRRGHGDGCAGAGGACVYGRARRSALAPLAPEPGRARAHRPSAHACAARGTLASPGPGA